MARVADATFEFSDAEVAFNSFQAEVEEALNSDALVTATEEEAAAVKVNPTFFDESFLANTK